MTRPKSCAIRSSNGKQKPFGSVQWARLRYRPPMVPLRFGHSIIPVLRTCLCPCSTSDNGAYDNVRGRSWAPARHPAYLLCRPSPGVGVEGLSQTEAQPMTERSKDMAAALAPPGRDCGAPPGRAGRCAPDGARRRPGASRRPKRSSRLS